ncbi:MAG TPA: SET domain-containing protein-lysine N-methyltransferase [Acidobacteriota bacterium]|jgi:SET domain-containing protein|nr:SET domain-containing protein-lysine N-methyltransferase [Acidobacteriota bacterium]
MTVSSYINPKAKKGKKSGIHGRGLFALKPIEKDEIVAIKGGHILSRVDLKKKRKIVGDSYIQIDDDFFLAPLTKEEHDKVMMFLNHSCEPNVGVKGQITYVAMRDIKPGEELTLDYAMIDDDDFSMECKCGKADCRNVVTGKDWQKKNLQKKYGNYFTTFILNKIRRRRSKS